MCNNKKITFKVVIPARYDSSRLPGKPLKTIAGKTMIHRVYKNAIKSGADQVIVATDDLRIVNEVNSFNGCVSMTSSTHLSGTDRIAEIANKENWSKDTIIVNLQGDEPSLPPSLVYMVANALENNKTASIATIATPITNMPDLFNPNTVKVVKDDKNMALYFSRAPIPWVRDDFAPWVRDDFAKKQNEIKHLPKNITFLRHLGLYAYRADALLKIAIQNPSIIETAESLEQLRAMSMGYKIHISVIDDAPGHGVDTKEDLKRVEQHIKQQIEQEIEKF